ncbi:MAG: hypothetical protein VR70_02525 [Rhodospirillaceae bacterium BRH_c57]|nr:MAG: hypothetical protein VR70_02525 [Rhodospirillaceae bacterium BRH_c57]
MTPPLHLSRFRLDLPRLFAWAAARRLPLEGGDLGYTVHCVLRAALGEDGPQPFSVHQLKADWDHSETVVYGYGPADGQRLRERLAASPDPAAAQALGEPQIKPLPDAWPRGLDLVFTVRVCPVVRQDCGGDRTRSKETDAFLVATNGRDPEEHPVDRGAVYAAWLARELARDGAAEMIDARMTAFARLPIRRRGGKPRGSASGSAIKPDATLEGRLRVTDPDAFARLLARGVGRHRAFGFGMVLLKPA